MVVAIIGILAAIALPAYQDYTVRSKVSELLLAASAARTSITEAAQNLGTVTGSGSGLAIGVGGNAELERDGDDGDLVVRSGADQVLALDLPHRLIAQRPRHEAGPPRGAPAFLFPGPRTGPRGCTFASAKTCVQVRRYS
ncbi:MAG: pilin [Burkholderiales bacterium]|nr:pilin [Burkholderiales bacterium]